MQSDLSLKNDQIWSEPWQALSASVAVTVALAAGIAWVMIHLIRVTH